MNCRICGDVAILAEDHRKHEHATSGPDARWECESGIDPCSLHQPASPTDPRDALAQRHALSTRLRALVDRGVLPEPPRNDTDLWESAILADGSRYLSPAQAAEQDRLVALGKAVERLRERLCPDCLGQGWYQQTQGDENGEPIPVQVQCDHRGFDDAIAVALDEPVTGEPDWTLYHELRMAEAAGTDRMDMDEPVTGEPER